MECSEKPIFHNYTRQELAQIRITAPEEAVRSLVKKHWDTLAKPLDGMGSFETITAQIGAILGTEQIDLTLFPYMTLFRSIGRASCRERV